MIYTILPDKDAWQIHLVFKEEIYPIPGKRYSSHEVAKLVVKQMEREDQELWQVTNLAKASLEFDEHGKPITQEPQDDSDV